MKWIKKHINEILTGLVVSILTFFITHLGEKIINSAPEIGHSIWNTITNAMYTAVATQSDSWASQSVYAALLSFLLGLCCFQWTFSLAFYRKHKKPKRKIQQEQQLDVDDQVKRKENSRGHSTILILALILETLYIFLMIFTSFYPAKINAAFKKDITMIRPYIEEQQVYKLQSDWVRMRSEKDYIAIYEKIDSIKDANNIEQ